jgi:5-methylcytosine-specific restriction endonuclease McrA
MAESLVLNSAGIPVSIVSWQRAITLYFMEKAVILAEYKDQPVRSINFSMFIPAVIQCIQSNYMPKRFVRTLPFSRRNVYVRDNGSCVYCGRKVSLANFTFDHVIPQSKGGKTTWNNVVVCCMRCNNKKGNKTPAQARMFPIKKPCAPRLDKAAPANLVSKVAAEIPHESWEDYIYWNVILEE